MLEQTDFTPLTSAEIDSVSGGVALFSAVVAVGALIAVAYQIGYSRGENDGAKTCPAN